MNKDSHDRKYVSHSKIVGYWMNKSITSDAEIVDMKNAPFTAEDVVTDIGEPECWGCRKQIYAVYDMKTYTEMLESNPAKIWDTAAVRKELQRCHIVPHSLGGSDTDPGNYFLLCDACHRESPDTANPKNFLRWFYRKRKGVWVNGWDGTKPMEEIQAECKRQGKDPSTFNPKDMTNAVAHGGSISDATFVYSFVDACKKAEGTV